MDIRRRLTDLNPECVPQPHLTWPILHSTESGSEPELQDTRTLLQSTLDEHTPTTVINTDIFDSMEDPGILAFL